MRPPNTQECIYFGRKLSSLDTDIESNAHSVCIGSPNDEAIYFGDCLEPGEDLSRERVTIYAEVDDVEVKLDLEDILVFAKKYCNGIFERVAMEAKEKQDE